LGDRHHRILAAKAFGAATFYVTLCNQAVIAWSISWGLAVIAGMMYRKEMGAERIRNEVAGSSLSTR
jgi:short subunit fatty acids transporter